MNYNAKKYLEGIKLNKWYRFDNIPGEISFQVIELMDQNWMFFGMKFIWDDFGEHFAKVNKKEINVKINY